MKKLITLLTVAICLNGKAQLLSYNGKSYFINGVNIPWNQYASDFGTNYLHGNLYDSTWFETAFTKFQTYGINCARVWIHNDGNTSPTIDTTTGYVTGLDPVVLASMDDMFKRALRHHVMIIPSLWSFNMTNNDYALGANGGMHADLIQDTLKTRSYITNALIPLVQHFANQCNLLAWEIINEPEWSMNVPSGGTQTQVVAASDMQCLVGMCAEAIHKNSTKMVTVGSATLRYNSDEFSVSSPCYGNYWKDAAIQSAYNKPQAFLDFYEVHYYDWMNSVISFDPYKSGCQASFWELDKPTLIGESQGNSTKHSPTTMLYNAFTGNYAGVLFWSYNAGADSMGQFVEFNSALLAFRNAATSIVDFDTTTCLQTTGISNYSSLNTNISIYPNPNNGSFVIEPSSATKQTMQVYDVNGKMVLSQTINGKTNIDASSLNEGVYNISLQNNKGVVNKRLVIVR